MYFPYLRSKQNELLALRELLPIMDNQKISPIIEIVNGKSLKQTFNDFMSYGINSTIIINPEVGELVGDYKNIIKSVNATLSGYSNFQFGILLGTDASYIEIVNFIESEGITFNGYSLIHNSTRHDLDKVIHFFKDKKVINNVIYLGKTKNDSSYHTHFENNTKVLLDDYFFARERNVDYLGVSRTGFSNNFYHYKSIGLKGFSDFLTIGDHYSDKGFQPRAVAIHITHEVSNSIFVEHFVSDSNRDKQNVAGKFAEALNKLVSWYVNDKIIKTKALEIFIEHHKNKHYPGLGVVKKLSIMNHIELINRLIK